MAFCWVCNSHSKNPVPSAYDSWTELPQTLQAKVFEGRKLNLLMDDQIRKLIEERNHYWLTPDIMQSIECLFKVPQGQDLAMHCVVAYNLCHVSEVLDGETLAENPRHTEHYRLDKMLLRFVHHRWTEGDEPCEEKWNLSGLWEDIQESHEDLEVYGRDRMEFAFDRVLGYLYQCQQRRNAVMLAKRVAGHRLPPELVEMIELAIHNGESLKEVWPALEMCPLDKLRSSGYTCGCFRDPKFVHIEPVEENIELARI